MGDVPFTVQADLDLGARVAPYLRDHAADVTIREGSVPQRLDTVEQSGGAYEVNATQFLLNVPGGGSYFVEDGQRITYARNGTSDRDLALFMLGTAWGALCYQRGLLPLHASAVICEGRVHAFTGISGAGKSTLAAALSERGLPFFTDDVLIIDPAEIRADGARCYAGQKDMKLWADAFELTASKKLGPVRDAPDFQKFFAAPASLVGAGSGDLASLTLLKNENVRRDRDPIAIERITGAMAVKRLRESIYRVRLANAIMGRQKLYTALARLIATVHVQTFDRPLDDSAFADSTAAIHDWIAGFGKGTGDGDPRA